MQAEGLMMRTLSGPSQAQWTAHKVENFLCSFPLIDKKSNNPALHYPKELDGAYMDD
jgi:hypothetical protein